MALQAQEAVASDDAAPRFGASRQPLLQVDGIAIRFGGIVALDGITFNIAPGEILGLIGPDGAGQTTLHHCVSPLFTPTARDIPF